MIHMQTPEGLAQGRGPRAEIPESLRPRRAEATRQAHLPGCSGYLCLQYASRDA